MLSEISELKVLINKQNACVINNNNNSTERLLSPIAFSYGALPADSASNVIQLNSLSDGRLQKNVCVGSMQATSDDHAITQQTLSSNSANVIESGINPNFNSGNEAVFVADNVKETGVQPEKSNC